MLPKYTYDYMYIYIYIYIEREKDRETERQRQRQRDRKNLKNVHLFDKTLTGTTRPNQRKISVEIHVVMSLSYFKYTTHITNIQPV